MYRLAICLVHRNVGRVTGGSTPNASQVRKISDFLENHVKSMVSVDFFTVPTIGFEVLYIFVVLAHERRRIVHFGVTAHPTAEWTAQQLREAFPWDTAPRYLLRDRDAIFGGEFVEQVKAFGIKQVLSAPRSPCLASAHQSVLEYRRVSMRVSRPQVKIGLAVALQPS